MKISVDELTELVEYHANTVKDQHREIIDLRRKLGEYERAERNPDLGPVVLRVECEAGGLAEFHAATELARVLNDRRFHRDALLEALARRNI